MGSIPAWENEIFIYMYIFNALLWCRGKARRWVAAIQNSAENGERSVLIPTSTNPAVCGIQREADLFFIYNILTASAEILSTILKVILLLELKSNFKK